MLQKIEAGTVEDRPTENVYRQISLSRLHDASVGGRAELGLFVLIPVQVLVVTK